MPEIRLYPLRHNEIFTGGELTGPPSASILEVSARRFLNAAFSSFRTISWRKHRIPRCPRPVAGSRNKVAQKHRRCCSPETVTAVGRSAERGLHFRRRCYRHQRLYNRSKDTSVRAVESRQRQPGDLQLYVWAADARTLSVVHVNPGRIERFGSARTAKSQLCRGGQITDCAHS